MNLLSFQLDLPPLVLHSAGNSSMAWGCHAWIWAAICRCADTSISHFCLVWPCKSDKLKTVMLCTYLTSSQQFGQNEQHVDSYPGETTWIVMCAPRVLLITPRDKLHPSVWQSSKSTLGAWRAITIPWPPFLTGTGICLEMLHYKWGRRRKNLVSYGLHYAHPRAS